MKRLVVSLVTFFALVFGHTAPGLALTTQAQPSEIVQVAHHKKEHKPKGKAKGHKKKAGKSSKDRLPKPKKNKKNKGKNKKGGKNQNRLQNPKADRGGNKAGNNRLNRPRSNDTPDRQLPERCVIIEKPIKTVVEYRTKTETKTEKVLEYGIMALVAIAAALLALYIGYVLGWRGSDKHEQKAWEDLLEEEKDN